jgi:hypothetical protein
MILVDSIGPVANFEAFLRDKEGRVVPDSIRRAHNVFTVSGRNWLSKLVAWFDLSTTPDDPYTNRRVRWMGVGSGSQAEVTNVTALQNAVPVTTSPTEYLKAISSVEFPTSTSVRFNTTFGTTEISEFGPVVVTEAGLFADVEPYNFVSGGEGEEDTQGSGTTVLDLDSGTNPPAAYKSFDPITKTQDFTFELRWELRF